MLFSIVIPAYNAEPFLRRCIDSCLNQKGCIPNYEIIIVNDGSTDGTQGIIEEYVNEGISYDTLSDASLRNADATIRDGATTKCSAELRYENSEGSHSPKVSFVCQANGGLSKARNEGLKKAQGEYVWFVDSDDWIAENALAVLTQIINENNHPDVITFRGCDWREGKINKRSSAFSADTKGQSGMDLLWTMGNKYWNPCVPFYCMKRQFLIANSLHFMEGVIHEDSEFTPRMLYIAKTAYVSSEVLYYVYQNPVSLNRKKNPEKAFHTLRVIGSLSSFCSGISNKKERLIFNDIIATTMNMAMKETKDMDQDRFTTFCTKIQKNMIACMIESTKLKHKVEGLMLMVMPRTLVKFVSKHQ